MKRLVILAVIILGVTAVNVNAESDYMSVLRQYQNKPQSAQQQVKKHYMLDKNGNKTGYVVTNQDKSVSIYDMNGKLIKTTSAKNTQSSQKKFTSYKDVQPAKSNRRALQNLF